MQGGECEAWILLLGCDLKIMVMWPLSWMSCPRGDQECVDETLREVPTMFCWTLVTLADVAGPRGTGAPDLHINLGMAPDPLTLMLIALVNRYEGILYLLNPEHATEWGPNHALNKVMHE